MSALRDPLMFQEKLLDAMEELIEEYESSGAHQNHFEGFYAAYLNRRQYPHTIEGDVGLWGAFLSVFAHLNFDVQGSVDDPRIRKVHPPSEIKKMLFPVFEELLQSKPAALDYIVERIRAFARFPDPDDIETPDLKKMILRCFEVYAICTTLGGGITLSYWSF